MASKKSTKATKKTSKPKRHYPAVRGSFLGSTTENQTVRVFDTAAALSRLNRRLYRFARVYPVSIGMIPTETQTVEVYALRDDWAVHKGIQMAYQQYLKNTQDERDATSTPARWEDFRIDHGVAVVDTLVPKLHDSSFASILQTEGEFALSTVVDQANIQRTFTFGTVVGATEYGVLQEYDKAGNAPQTPDSTSGVPGGRLPYGELDTERNEQTALDLEQNGDLPPYDKDGVNADSPWVKIATLGSSVGGAQRLSTGFFNAPCGLVVLVGSGASWNSDSMMFEVKTGQYKGVGGMSLLE
jgi:hypothetical protein